MAYFLILAAAILRFLPHLPNFAPITAMALFGGAYLNKKFAFLVPIAAMVVSDYFIGFDSLESRAIVYGSFMLSGGIGLWIKNHKSIANIVGGTLLSSVLFYLVTNFAFFYPPTMYSHDLSGVIASYINALPFFRGTLLGDFFYVGVTFGSYELAVYLKDRKKASDKTQKLV